MKNPANTPNTYRMPCVVCWQWAMERSRMIEPEYDYDDMVMAQRIDDCEALLLEAAQFLAELPQDLGRGSLNGWRVQLQHKIEVMVPNAQSTPAKVC